MNTILCPERHQRLIKDITHVCQVAGVPEAFLHQSMQGQSPEKDIFWVTNYPRAAATGKAGLVLTGKHGDLRAMRLCAALVRNFIDARVIPLSKVLEWEKDADAPNPTVLIIPNFAPSATDGQKTPQWQVQRLYDLLLSRFSTGKQTVLYVQSMKDLTAMYGSTIASHLTDCYVFSEDIS